jgi:phage tail sheath protein FI
VSTPLPPGVYITDTAFGAHAIEGGPTSETGFMGLAAKGPANQATLVTSFAEFQRVFGGLRPQAELGYAVDLFFANGGRRAWIVRVSSISKVPLSLVAYDTARVNMLCVPGCSDPAVLIPVLAYCERNRVFAVIDPPSADVAATRALASTLRSNNPLNSALYFPPITIPDPLHALAPRQTPPSGAVAGLIALTDMTRGVWIAPAGNQAVLQGVMGVTLSIDQARAAVLAAAGVNAIRKIPPGGIVVWSAQTLSPLDPWKYVPVRRYVLYLEESLHEGLGWAVFEPSDEPLWSRLKVDICTFLTHEWRLGALVGATADQAFFVKTGREVMSQADITGGRAVILVGFTPTGSLSLITLRVIVQTQ